MHHHDEKNSGTLIEQIACIDGEIFLLENRQEKEEVKRFITQYDGSGNLVRDFSSEDINEFLKDGRASQMSKLGNYLLICNWDGELALFRQEEDSFALCYLFPVEIRTNMQSMHWAYDSSRYPYIYFYENSSQAERAIFSFHLKTGEWKKYILSQADDSLSNISYIRMDLEGNLLVTLQNPNEGLSKYYLIKSQLLQ